MPHPRYYPPTTHDEARRYRHLNKLGTNCSVLRVQRVFAGVEEVHNVVKILVMPRSLGLGVDVVVSFHVGTLALTLETILTRISPRLKKKFLTTFDVSNYRLIELICIKIPRVSGNHVPDSTDCELDKKSNWRDHF